MSDKKISGIRALRDKLTTKAVSCAELTQAYLDAIARDNGRLNAYGPRHGGHGPGDRPPGG